MTSDNQPQSTAVSINYGNTIFLVTPDKVYVLNKGEIMLARSVRGDQKREVTKLLLEEAVNNLFNEEESARQVLVTAKRY